MTPRPILPEAPPLNSAPTAVPLVLILLVGLSSSSAATPDAEPGLSVSPERSLDGVYQLEWSAMGAVVLEESRSADFARPVVVYAGRDQATTLSGRADGTYYYRLHAATEVAGAALQSDAPPIIRVEVAHHPLSRAVGFFLVGLLVFTATVGLVVSGERRTRSEEADPLV